MTDKNIFIFVLFVMALGSINCLWGYDFPPLHDSKCGFTREKSLNCAIKYGDANDDNKLTPTELQHALDTLIPSYLNNRLFRWISGLSVEQVLKDCDYNKDGVLTPRDWELSKKTCMPTQENLCTFKWFCDYAAKQKNKKIK